MTLFKSAKEWIAFVSGRKFVRHDNAAIYHFTNPMLNKGFNLKVLWKGKEILTNVEFHTMGSAIMKIGDEIFALKRVHIDILDPKPSGKDIFYTVLKGQEVRFQAL